MARKRRLHKRYRRNPETSSRSNPPLFTDLAEFILPGFAGFAATRLLTRIVSTQVAKRKPSWGKHIGALASVASFFAAWYGAHRVKALEKYHTPIVVGAAIAGIQSIIQFYIPGLGWMIADSSPEIAQLEAPDIELPDGAELLDEDPDDYVYNDTFSNGVKKPASSGGPKTQAQKEDEILQDLNIDGEDIADINLGSLGPN